MAVPTSTSSFNWWPYPPWGQSTSSTVIPAYPQTTLTPTIASVNALVTSLATATLSSSSLPVVSSPQTQTSSFNLAAVTSSSTTPGATLSLTTITALPPSKTAIKHVRPTKAGFDIIYLTPVFAVLGVVLGIACTWAFLILLARRNRRRRVAALEPGPEYDHTVYPRGYVPPLDARSSTIPGSETEPLNGDTGYPIQRVLAHSAGNGGYTQTSEAGNGGWLSRMLSKKSKEQTPLPPLPLDDDLERTPLHSEAPRGTHPSEDDPFLVSPASSRRPNHPMRSRSILTTSFLSSSPLSDEECDRQPWDTLRHKSIRRGILDRIQSGTMYRNGHKREGSDMNVDEIRAVRGGVYSHAENTSTPSRTMSGTSSRRATETPAMARGVSSASSGPGFRIVDEDPEVEAGLAQPEPRSGFGWSMSLPWMSSSSSKPDIEDRLTALPSRRARSPSSSPSRHAHRAASAHGEETTERMTMRRVDSSVLPASPPMLMSPPLEEQLFFGPASTVTASVHGNANNRHVPPADARKSRKLHTTREAPSLPFPSSASDPPYRNRLSKAPPASSERRPSRTPAAASIYSAESVSVYSPETQVYRSSTTSTRVTRTTTSSTRTDAKTPTPSSASRTGLRSPAERYHARHGALTKVHDIVSKGYTERDMRGEKRVGSPTMFGALPVQTPLMGSGTEMLSPATVASAETGVSGMRGIEERLAGL
ncbi:hypothetical protein K474DRAFT_1712522 [Panus rudis PR-1116 ss-1]|nr:hypothetical protein K474DRAFT_1712522 [Panus rudis PR-1116 ss-1]